MFGAGIYFAENSSKSNQYVWGIGGGTGCPIHKDKSCYTCKRQLILCRVTLGELVCSLLKPVLFQENLFFKLRHKRWHTRRLDITGNFFLPFFDNLNLLSVIGRPSAGGLCFPEYVIYRGEQAYPEYLVSYTIQKPT